MCKSTLQDWQKNTFRRANVEIIKLKEKLNVLQNQEHQQINGEEIKKIQEDIKRLWRQEELFWCQRSRVKWLKDGDRNSKFFHATTIQRRGNNLMIDCRIIMGSGLKGKLKFSILLLITSRKFMHQKIQLLIRSVFIV